MFENISQAYLPKSLEDANYTSLFEPEIKVLDSSDHYIMDYFGIPSSLSLMNADSSDP